ncbi:MAG: helix-turn-helix domain-containing protein [Clostridia bacterium]|nr:helix-turn-helix domain-containing protein [Clostridia bacterium]
MQRTRWFRHIDMRRALEEIPQGVVSALPEERTLLMDIMQLPDKYRKPILLYYYQDMNLEETAQVLGISKSTVHNRLRKAEGLLKLAMLGEEKCPDGVDKGGDCYV